MAHVLVIDDNRSVLQTLGFCSERLGHTPILAEDGRTGLNLAAESGVDTVLLDVDMPVMNGLAVCRAIKSNPATRNLPVIIMSGCPRDDIAVRAFAAGATEFMAKPFTMEALQTVLLKSSETEAFAKNENAGSHPQSVDHLR